MTSPVNATSTSPEMAGYLLDTNVISELYRPAPEPAVVAWFALRDPQDLFLSAITIGELTSSVRRLPAEKRRDQIQSWLDDDLTRQFFGRILSFDLRTATIWGRLLGDAIRQGQSRPVIDAQIAATAIQHELALVTRNISDFDNLDLDVRNPWES